LSCLCLLPTESSLVPFGLTFTGRNFNVNSNPAEF
jgi:hypothetical protein